MGCNLPREQVVRGKKGENGSLFQLCRAETLFYVNVWDLLGYKAVNVAPSFLAHCWCSIFCERSLKVSQNCRHQFACSPNIPIPNALYAWIVAIHPYCKINALTLATSRKWLRCHWRLQQRDCRALNVTQVWHFWFWSRLFLLSFVACLLASVERALRKLQAQVVDVPCKLSDCQTLDILKFKLNIPLDPSVSCPNISMRRGTNSAPG